MEGCFLEGVNLVPTILIGLFVVNEVAVMVSVFANSHVVFSEENQFQLRGMELTTNIQKRGFGKLLLNKVENVVFQKNKKAIIWFNARQLAVDFYKKSNYQIIDTPFEIKEIGTHYIMYKKLELS